SWLRAEQTDVWHKTVASQPDTNVKPHYDFGELDKLVHTINEHNDAWKEWFERNDIEPYSITYEQLDAEPVQTILDLSNYLGLKLSTTPELKADNKRLADDTSTEWATRYHAESAKRLSTI